MEIPAKVEFVELFLSGFFGRSLVGRVFYGLICPAWTLGRNKVSTHTPGEVPDVLYVVGNITQKFHTSIADNRQFLRKP